MKKTVIFSLLAILCISLTLAIVSHSQLDGFSTAQYDNLETEFQQIITEQNQPIWITVDKEFVGYDGPKTGSAPIPDECNNAQQVKVLYMVSESSLSVSGAFTLSHSVGDNNNYCLAGYGCDCSNSNCVGSEPRILNKNPNTNSVSWQITRAPGDDNTFGAAFKIVGCLIPPQ